MNNAKDLASQRATEQTLKQPPPPQQKETDLTTFEDMLAGYKTGIVKASSGETFEIQCVSPGDFLLSTGSPLIQAISEGGIDLTDEAGVKKVIEEFSSGEALDLVTDEDFLELAKKNSHSRYYLHKLCGQKAKRVQKKEKGSIH